MSNKGAGRTIGKGILSGLCKMEGRRRREQRGVIWLGGVTDSVDMSLGGLGELVVDGEAWRAAVPQVAKSWIRLSH